MAEKLVNVKALVPLHVKGATVGVGEAVELPEEAVKILVGKSQVEIIKESK